MARQCGALDARLLDWGSVTAEVLKEHDCSDGRACAACGYRPTRRQPVCWSVAVAQGLRCGRAPRWVGGDPVEVPESEDSGGEQWELFSVVGFSSSGGGSRRGFAERACVMDSMTGVVTTHSVGPVVRHLRVAGAAGAGAEAGTVADVAGAYCRMADELAAMVEAEGGRAARWHGVLAAALGELRAVLDELAAGVARGEW
jgi:hypothetical protein